MRVWRVVVDDAKHDGLALSIHKGDRGQRRVFVGEHKGHSESQAWERHGLRRKLGAYPRPDGAQLRSLQCGIGVQRREGFVGIEVRVVFDSRTPIFLLARWREAQRDPGCRARTQKETDNSRGNVAESDPGEWP